MRIFILIVNCLLFALSLFGSLLNGFDRVALSTWLFICFGMMLVFNVRDFWLHHHAKGKGVTSFRKKLKYDGPEKRSHFRVVYEPNKRPLLIIGENVFEVMDISQTGVRFLNHKDVVLAGNIEGRITFNDGDPMEVSGNIEWKKAEQMSMVFSIAIPHSFIKKELSQLMFV
jgi:hypothetical protein